MVQGSWGGFLWMCIGMSWAGTQLLSSGSYPSQSSRHCLLALWHLESKMLLMNLMSWVNFKIEGSWMDSSRNPAFMGPGINGLNLSPWKEYAVWYCLGRLCLQFTLLMSCNISKGPNYWCIGFLHLLYVIPKNNLWNILWSASYTGMFQITVICICFRHLYVLPQTSSLLWNQ